MKDYCISILFYKMAVIFLNMDMMLAMYDKLSVKIDSNIEQLNLRCVETENTLCEATQLIKEQQKCIDNIKLDMNNIQINLENYKDMCVSNRETTEGVKMSLEQLYS